MLNPDLQVLRGHRGLAALVALSLLALPGTPWADGAKGPANDTAFPSRHASATSVLQVSSFSSLTFAENPLDSQVATEMTIADVNGDGKLDVLMGGPLRVFLGNGDGTATSFWSSGIESYAAVLADITGDGFPDGVSTNVSSGFDLVFEGNGTGAFLPANKYKAGKTILDVAVADLNGDGRLDIVGTDAANDNAYVLIANKGGFKDRARYDVGSNPRGIAIADLDQDGRADLVVANAGSSSVSVLLGNGDGTFQPQSTTSIGGPAANPRDIDVLDLNGDGKLDVVTTRLDLGGGAARVVVILGNGDGTFGAQTPYSLGSVTDGSRSAALGDLNQDGITDMAVANPLLAGVFVLLGNGDGTFTFEASHPVSGSCNSVAIADMNGDGLNDIVTDSAILVNLGAPVAQLAGKAVAPREPIATTTSSTRVSPNPLHGDAILSFTLAKAGPVSVALFDMSGRLVRTLRSGQWAEAGRQELRLDRQGLAAGVYLYRIQSSGQTASGRMVVTN